MAITPEHVRRRFGVELRKWREHAGMSQPKLARAIPISQSQVSAIERGNKGTTPAQIRRFDQVLTTGGALIRRWEDLQQDGRGFPSWFAGVVAVERQASEIREYAPLLVPGLLQTLEYARASLRQGRPTSYRGRAGRESSRPRGTAVHPHRRTSPVVASGHRGTRAAAAYWGSRHDESPVGPPA